MLKPPAILNFDEKEPYIYVSYALEDAPKVFPILEKLQADGFRLWYDDGAADSDKERAKTAKTRLKRALFFLAFLSPSYLQSPSCAKEFQKGQAKDFSKFILLHIEDAQLDTASTLFFARAQNVRWYMSADNEPLCYYVLYEVIGLDKCNIHGEVPSIPLSAVYEEDGEASAAASEPNDPPQVHTGFLKKLSLIIVAACIVVFAFLLLRQ